MNAQIMHIDNSTISVMVVVRTVEAA